jgi:putative transposase
LILEAFGKRKSSAQQKYQQFVAEEKGLPQAWEQIKNQMFLGTESFINDLQKKIKTNKVLIEISKSKRRKNQNR